MKLTLLLSIYAKVHNFPAEFISYSGWTAIAAVLLIYQIIPFFQNRKVQGIAIQS